MSSSEADFPDDGALSIDWSVSVVSGHRRMSWTFSSDPSLDPRLAIDLLRDVAAELEQDIPSD